MFSRRSPRHRTATEVVSDITSPTNHRNEAGVFNRKPKKQGFFQRRKNPNRRAGGLKAALSNPNTTHSGKKHAKHELRAMGRGNEAKVSLSTRIKSIFHIRSSRTRPRRHL